MATLNNLTDTWNNSGTVFTGLKYTITDTASNAASLLIDFKVGSTSEFKVTKLGEILAADVSNLKMLTWGGDSVRGIRAGGGGLQIFDASSAITTIAAGGATFAENAALSWNSVSLLGTNIYEDSAGGTNAALSIRNATAAQTLRVYNTTDSGTNNYERGVFDWTTTSNVLTIGTQALGTGTQRPIVISATTAYIDLVAGGTGTLRYTNNGFYPTNTNTVDFGYAGGGFSWKNITFSGSLQFDNAGSVDLVLSRGAAGILKFASSGSFSANASVATVLGSVGPSGASTTVQKWLTIKDDGGTTRYIPCF